MSEQTDIVERLQNWQWANEGNDEMVEREVADEAAAEITRLRKELANGSAELRRSVEANGFEWQEGESAVWHAVTAIGLYRGTIDSLREENERLRRRLAMQALAEMEAVK